MLVVVETERLLARVALGPRVSLVAADAGEVAVGADELLSTGGQTLTETVASLLEWAEGNMAEIRAALDA